MSEVQEKKKIRRSHALHVQDVDYIHDDEAR